MMGALPLCVRQAQAVKRQLRTNPNEKKGCFLNSFGFRAILVNIPGLQQATYSVLIITLSYLATCRPQELMLLD